MIFAGLWSNWFDVTEYQASRDDDKPYSLSRGVTCVGESVIAYAPALR